MGRGREATQRRPVDLDALHEALADARAPHAIARPVVVPPVELVEYDARAARAWRARPRHDDAPPAPRQRRLVLLLIAIAHLALLSALHRVMQREPVPLPTAERETVLEITFGEPEPPMTGIVAAPEEPVATLDAQRPHVAPRPIAPAQPVNPARRDEGMSVFFGAPEPVPSPTPAPLRLFDSSGRPLVSQDVLDAADAARRGPQSDFRTPRQEAPEFMKHRRAISDERTRFEKYWVPDDENLGQKIVRKFPPAALILQGVNIPKCKRRSIAPDCEDQPLPQQFDDIMPNDVSEDPGIPR